MRVGGVWMKWGSTDLPFDRYSAWISKPIALGPIEISHWNEGLIKNTRKLKKLKRFVYKWRLTLNDFLHRFRSSILEPVLKIRGLFKFEPHEFSSLCSRFNRFQHQGNNIQTSRTLFNHVFELRDSHDGDLCWKLNQSIHSIYIKPSEEVSNPVNDRLQIIGHYV